MPSLPWGLLGGLSLVDLLLLPSGFSKEVLDSLLGMGEVIAGGA